MDSSRASTYAEAKTSTPSSSVAIVTDSKEKLSSRKPTAIPGGLAPVRQSCEQFGAQTVHVWLQGDAPLALQEGPKRGVQYHRQGIPDGLSKARVNSKRSRDSS